MPKSMSFDEASEYWDNHSTADVPSRIVEMQHAPMEGDRVPSPQRRPSPPLDSPSGSRDSEIRGKRGQKDPEAYTAAPIFRTVLVADGTPHKLRFDEERATANHTESV